MKRTTITLSDELAAIVVQEARRRGTSVSEVVRGSIVTTFGVGAERLIPWAGICDDPEMARGAAVDEGLSGWDDDADRRRR